MKNYITGLLGLLLMAGCVAEGQDGFVMSGKLKGIDTGWVRLISHREEDRTSKTVDSAKVVNGAFKLQGKVAVPEMMTLQIEPGGWSFPVFIENSSLLVSADTTGSVHFDYTAYGAGKFAQVKQYTEKGSADFDAWMAYQNDPGQQQFEQALQQLYKKITAVKGDVDKEYAVRDEMDSVKKLQQHWQKQKISQYVAQHPDAVAGVYLFNQLFRFSNQMPYRELDSMLKRFTGAAKASVYFETLDKARTRMKAIQVGELAPDFTLLQRDSTKLTLSASRGKYVLIDFWASWCHPCRKAIPHWKSVYQKYSGKGFEIISLSDDNDWKKWTAAMDVEKMPWKQVIDEFPVKGMPARVISQYMINAIPHYVLLDKAGRIIISTPDEHQIDEKLAGIFGK